MKLALLGMRRIEQTFEFLPTGGFNLEMRIATLSLTLLCLAFSATAFAGTIFNDGAIDGNDNGFFITGPNFPNELGSFQDISNGFTAGITANATGLEFGLWIGSGLTPTSVSYELGTTAFGTDLGSGTVALNAGNSHFLFTNGFGFDIYDVNIPVSSGSMAEATATALAEQCYRRH